MAEVLWRILVEHGDIVVPCSHGIDTLHADIAECLAVWLAVAGIEVVKCLAVLLVECFLATFAVKDLKVSLLVGQPEIAKNLAAEVVERAAAVDALTADGAQLLALQLVL